MTDRVHLLFPLGDGSEEEVVVEVERPSSGRVARGDTVVEKAKKSFVEAVEAIRPATAVLVSKLSELPRKPDGFEVKFAIALESEAGAIFASIGAKAHFEVTLKWGGKGS